MSDDATEPPKPSPPAKPKRARRRRRAKARPDLFAGFEEEIRAIDWSDTIKREAAMHALISRLMAHVITTPKLTKPERERLQWVVSLSKQLKEHRDPAAIEAALAKLRGEDEAKPSTVNGPTLEPTIKPARSEHEGEESSERGARPTLRGRPRVRALA